MTEPGEECASIESVMAVLGRAWAGSILDAMLEGRQRYSDLSRAVPGVTDSVLTTRLRELCEHGLADRVVDDGPPVAVRYLPTDAGRDMAPVIAALKEYAQRHPEVATGR
ncbi:MAG: winged helix-turn-helix transcriptional regulator [Microthrixaceae bacterium]